MHRHYVPIARPCQPALQRGEQAHSRSTRTPSRVVPWRPASVHSVDRREHHYGRSNLQIADAAAARAKRELGKVVSQHEDLERESGYLAAQLEVEKAENAALRRRYFTDVSALRSELWETEHACLDEIGRLLFQWQSSVTRYREASIGPDEGELQLQFLSERVEGELEVHARRLSSRGEGGERGEGTPREVGTGGLSAGAGETRARVIDGPGSPCLWPPKASPAPPLASPPREWMEGTPPRQSKGTPPRQSKGTPPRQSRGTPPLQSGASPPSHGSSRWCESHGRVAGAPNAPPADAAVDAAAGDLREAADALGATADGVHRLVDRMSRQLAAAAARERELERTLQLALSAAHSATRRSVCELRALSLELTQLDGPSCAGQRQGDRSARFEREDYARSPPARATQPSL